MDIDHKPAGFGLILISITVLLLFGIFSLSINTFTLVQHRQSVKKIFRNEGYFNGEIAAWHNYFLAETKAPLQGGTDAKGRHTASFEISYVGQSSALSETVYNPESYEPGISINLKTTQGFDPANTLLAHASNEMLRYLPPNMNTKGYCGYSVFKSGKEFRTCLAPSPNFSPSSGPPPRRLIVGDGVSCLIRKDGSVKCWGTGILGIVNEENKPIRSWIPISVPKLSSDVNSLYLNKNLTQGCAVMGGTLHCWGTNKGCILAKCELGSSYEPLALSTLPSGFSDVSIGGTTIIESPDEPIDNSGQSRRMPRVCAIVNGVGQCWGCRNYFADGRMGINCQDLDENLATPAPIPNIPTPVSRVDVGLSLNCALAKGRVFCWGDQIIGDGQKQKEIRLSEVVGLEKSVTDIAVGSSHACALVDKKVKCWGDNQNGQLGDGTTEERLTAVTVKNLSNPTFITAGGSTSCAVDSGKAYCWGALGGGDSPSSNSSPVEQALPSGVIEIAMGANHACALLPEERIYCWGGEALGVATQHAILKKPVLIRSVEESEAFKEALPPDKELKDLKNATSIAVGASASCALLEEGTIRCWGADGAGQLGQRTLASLKYSNVPIAINELKQVTEITMGREHSCAVASGVPYCWGSNRYGALGNNSSTDYSPNPVTPLNLAATEKISAGSDYTCAISNGTLKCWGNNDFGQLGNNSKTESKIPVPVEGMTDKVTTVALGTDHTCAIVDGLAKCWGRNDAGQLGNNSKTASNAPIAVETLTANVTAITVGSRHSCAIVNGGARCWGNNSSGQLGNNSTKDSLVPVPVQDLSSDVTAITAGSIHSCAIHKGRVKCWGGVDQGTGSVLGVNDRWALNTLIPQELIHLPSGASKMSAAEAHSCALVDHKVYCWGQDLFGRVGNRREVFEATASGSVVMVPVLVPILD